MQRYALKSNTRRALCRLATQSPLLCARCDPRRLGLRSSRAFHNIAAEGSCGVHGLAQVAHCAYGRTGPVPLSDAIIYHLKPCRAVVRLCGCDNDLSRLCFSRPRAPVSCSAAGTPRAGTHQSVWSWQWSKAAGHRPQRKRNSHFESQARMLTTFRSAICQRHRQTLEFFLDNKWSGEGA